MQMAQSWWKENQKGDFKAERDDNGSSYPIAGVGCAGSPLSSRDPSSALRQAEMSSMLPSARCVQSPRYRSC